MTKQLILALVLTVCFFNEEAHFTTNDVAANTFAPGTGD